MRRQKLQEHMYRQKIDVQKKGVVKNLDKMKKLQELETALLDSVQRQTIQQMEFQGQYDQIMATGYAKQKYVDGQSVFGST